jgi:molybdopterin-guanine dinucleotide biosynthesis protein A
MAMQSTDLFIVAAGNGSRLGGNMPKALIPIVGEPCLTTTLTQVGLLFRSIYVVTNVLSQDIWSSYFAELTFRRPELYARITNLPIKSGRGDGHAVLEGLLCAERIENGTCAEEVVVMWGDVFLPSAELMRELLLHPSKGAGLLPAIFEQDPYVCLRVDAEMRCMSADFSKHGERHASGLHDQSVFKFARSQLRDSLVELHRCLWKHDRYIAAGGELSLLYTFHQMYNCGNPVYVYETRHGTRSFNTREEVLRIRDEMGMGVAADLAEELRCPIYAGSIGMET